MRDGVSLMADIWLPDTGDKHPTILISTPYDRTKLDNVLWDPDLAFNRSDRQNYVFVGMDWRGFGGSKAAKKGGFGQVPMDQHGMDGHDAVEWIAKQEWSDGKVGMWGGSAVGRVQFHTAAQQPPHLVCAVPEIAPYGLRHEQFFENGVLRTGYVGTLEKGYGPIGMILKAIPGDSALWEKWEGRKDPDKIDIPMLLITGWFDLFPGAVIDTFQEIRSVAGPKAKAGSKLVIGPWSHTEVGKLVQGDLEFPGAAGVPGREARRFFEHWLAGKRDNGADAEPVFRYFVMGSDAWKSADRWPPAEGPSTILYLTKDGGLAGSASEESSSRTFKFDPADPSPTIGGSNAFIKSDPNYKAVGQGPKDQRPVEKRSDALVYTSSSLDEGLTLFGRPEVTLHVSSDRPDTDFAVRLTDVQSDGRSILVADGIMRMRHRGGDAKKSSLLENGRIYPVTFKLGFTAYTFDKGHKVRLVVTSSNSPRFEVSGNMDRARLIGPKSRVATNQVHHGRQHASSLKLPGAAEGMR